jgi:hypothetical protein
MSVSVTVKHRDLCKTFLCTHAELPERVRQWVSCANARHFENLPTDIVEYIMKLCTPKGRCATAECCKQLYATESGLSVLKTLDLSMRRILPLHEDRNFHWTCDAAAVAQTLVQERFACLDAVHLFMDTFAFTSGGSYRYRALRSVFVPLRIKLLTMTCCTRWCPTPSAFYVNRLVLSAASTLHTVKFVGMQNVGDAHLAALSELPLLSALHLVCCRITGPVRGRLHETLDGSFLRASRLSELVLDVDNIDTAVRNFLHTGLRSMLSELPTLVRLHLGSAFNMLCDSPWAVALLLVGHRHLRVFTSPSSALCLSMSMCPLASRYPLVLIRRDSTMPF